MAWDPKNPEPVEYPAGLAGMVAHENRLLTTPEELLSAEGVAMDDLLIRKEPGLAAYDTSGLQLLPSFLAAGTRTSGGGTSDVVAGGILATFPAGVVGVTPAVGGTAASGTTAGAVAVSTTVPVGGYALGSLVVVANHFTGLAGGGNGVVTDTGGNTYTRVATVLLAASGANAEFIVLYYSRLTTGLVAGNTITVTYLASGAQNMLVSNFTGTAATHDRSATATQTTLAVPVGGSAPVTVVSTQELSSVPQLLVGVYGATITADAMTTAYQSAFVESIEHSSANSGELAIGYRFDASLDAKIVALTDWYSDAETTPAGTVSTSAGDTTVTGVGTTFTAHAPGDRVIVNNETRIIETITSDTILDTTVMWVSTYSGLPYQRRVGNRLITATSGGNIFKEKPTSLTTGNLDDVTLVAGLNPSARTGRFIPAGKEAAALDRRLFYFNGVDVPRVLVGDATSMVTIDTATNPADWADVADQGEQPINAIVHQNRLVAFGNLNDPHRIYLSDPDDHDDWTSADAMSIRVRSDIGDRLYCAAAYQGILFLWKFPRGIFYLDDTSLTATDWLTRTKSESIGCAPSPYAVLSVDDDALFIDPNAHFHLLSAVDAFGGARDSDVTLQLGLSRWTRDNINLKRLSQTVSYWYPQKKLAVFYVPSTGSNDPDLALKFDFSGRERGLPVKFSFSRRDAASAAAIRRASDGGPETPVIGENEFVYLADQEARNKAGLGYPMDYRLPNHDLANVSQTLRTSKKTFEHLELLMEPVAAGTLTVEFLVDGVVKQTLEFDATKNRDKHKLNVGDGWTWSIRVLNEAANEEGKILSHIIYFKVGDTGYAYNDRTQSLGEI